jgi:hypothetical protein
MSKDQKPKILRRLDVSHLVKSDSKNPVSRVIIYDNGNIGMYKLKIAFMRVKEILIRELTPADITKIETSSSSGQDTRISIKITDSHGNTDAFMTNVITRRERNLVAAKLPIIFSSFYGDKYSKL